MKKQRYPLSIHITSLFLVLTTVVGIVLITISYHHSQTLLTKSAEGLSKEHAHKLESTFQTSVGPVLTTLDLLSVSSFLDDYKQPEKFKPWLETLVNIFEKNTNLVALYHASETGSLTQYRILNSPEIRNNFEAPINTFILINNTHVDGTNEFIYLDDQFKQIAQKKTSDNKFDPRVRPWFINAERDGEIRLTEPYFFFFLKTNGVTLSRRSANGQHVVGADFTLASLSNQIKQLANSRQTRLALLDKDHRLLAQHQLNIDPSLTFEQQKALLERSIFSPLLNSIGQSATQFKTAEFDGEEWSVTLTPVKLTDNVELYLFEASPTDEILADLLSLRDKQVLTAIFLLAVCFCVVWLVANRLAKPLQNLVYLTDNIARFNFKRTRYPQSMIKEVSNLTSSIELMEHTLHDLLRLLRDTAGNQEFAVLAKTIAHQAYLVTRAETILLYIKSEEENKLVLAANHAIIPFKVDINEFVSETPWLMAQLKEGDSIHLDRNTNALKRHHDTIFNSDVFLFPLLNREKQLVGIVTVGYERPPSEAQLAKHAFLRELLSFAEIAKDNIDQMQQQKEMLNAFIELIASAIDTKSPYTGGHCQRVPQLVTWLTEVTEGDNKYFPSFHVNNKQWEEIKLAAWMHDCGKVTTPEYVVDKATKLETIYDRIHEVRMRFEVLKLQGEVDYWKARYKGEDPDAAKAHLTTLHRQLDEDFAFVARCNVGGESMDEADIQRLKTIAKKEWKRTLDDQLGVSWIEQQRHINKTELPVMEPLLADKEVHKVPWESNINPTQSWQQDYVLTPGEYKYDRGELHNLTVRYGTLTDEERFIINDHIIQTQIMLNRLPYPEHLKNIPEIAGGHHERMDGKGYPLGLHEEELSVPARIMAIADVFEALTSADRPYKKGKTLAESLEIMTNMATSGHIDPKLYLLFLIHKIDQKYANAFVDRKQWSEIDRETHIQKVKTYMRHQF
ncbi:metal-dependent phosphohydrolase [Vibrio vulnificus]|nr:metal-dependent phosphohydrolase [Vibrio vulnificus]